MVFLIRAKHRIFRKACVGPQTRRHRAGGVADGIGIILVKLYAYFILYYFFWGRRLGGEAVSLMVR